MQDTDTHGESDHRGGQNPPKEGTCPYFPTKEPAVNNTARMFLQGSTDYPYAK